MLGFFTITTIVYAAEHGVHGITRASCRRRPPSSSGSCPYLLFNYVGFELQNGAAEEMVNPHRDVPITVVAQRSARVLMYVLPILGILLVLPASTKITNIGGFIDAMTEMFGVYGSAGRHAVRR